MDAKVYLEWRAKLRKWVIEYRGHADRHAARITATELDSSDQNTLQPALTMPPTSLSSARKSGPCEQAEMRTYAKSSGPKGIGQNSTLSRDVNKAEASKAVFLIHEVLLRHVSQEL